MNEQISVLSREEKKKFENIRRLAYCLYTHSDDRTINQLAYILDYTPEQLSTDIADFENCTRKRV